MGIGGRLREETVPEWWRGCCGVHCKRGRRWWFGLADGASDAEHSAGGFMI